MTLIDLNPMEIDLTIELLKLDIEDIRSDHYRLRSVPEYTRKEWTNHIQSVIYKLEKGLSKK